MDRVHLRVDGSVAFYLSPLRPVGVADAYALRHLAAREESQP